MTSATIHNLLTTLVVIVLLAAALFLARRPYYNWDMFPYMALVMREPAMPFDSLHAAVYESARASMPARDFNAISSRQPVFRDDPRAFEAILPYYEIKPGYTLFARSLYALGIQPLAATWIPSIFAYFGLCVTLFFWSKSTSTLAAAALLTAIVASSPPLVNLSRYSSPDMLATFVQVSGMLLIVTNRVQLGLALLTSAVTIRPDTALLAVPLSLALLLSGKLSRMEAAGWSLASVLIVVLLFMKTGLLSEYLLVELSPPERIRLYGEGWSRLLQSYFTPFACLAVILLFVKRRTLTVELVPLLIMAALLSLVARLLLHPYVEDRFNLAAYMLILLAGWQTVAASLYPTYRQKR